MSNIPTSLSEVCLSLFRLAIPGQTRGLSPETQSPPLIQISNPIQSNPSVHSLLLCMARIRGFSLKHHVFRFFRRHRRHPSAAYRRIGVRPFSGLVTWTQRIRAKARAIILGGTRGYVRVGHDPIVHEPIPKGHMAVYVGQKDGGDFERVLVPVVYFNHPLFGDLLRESEKEYGFNHPGGITIPCRISEFERVQTRIQCAPAGAGAGAWRLPPWKKS